MRTRTSSVLGYSLSTRIVKCDAPALCAYTAFPLFDNFARLPCVDQKSRIFGMRASLPDAKLREHLRHRRDAIYESYLFGGLRVERTPIS